MEWMEPGATILAVDDDLSILTLLESVLGAAGYRVLLADGGRRAVELFESATHPIDLLLTDVIMPGMNGKELADQLAALRPGIKVLFISGYSGELIAHRGVLAAGVDYLAKPFTPDQLVAKVREMLGSANQARAQEI
jgi:two-component system, cell cycle sensor histidine kinase and response regulator CckA